MLNAHRLCAASRLSRLPVLAPKRRLATAYRTSSGHHDLGGVPGLLESPVPADEPLHAWELEAHALFACLAKRGYFSTDESRRTIEGFTADAYG